MKKIRIIILLILILVTAFIIIGAKIDHNNILLKMNWDIWLPKPNNVEIIYSFDYREGDDFEIWTYNDSKIDSIKENKIFTLITEDNLQDIKNIFNSHYSNVSYNEDLQEKYNENFSVDDNIVEGNYYHIKKDDNCYLLLLVNTKSNKLYYFNHIR